MAALRRLDERACDGHASGGWKFHYFGKHGRHVWEQAERFGVTGRVIVHGQVPRSEALAAVKGAGAAVVITSVVESARNEDNGMVTGKIFEAIGLGTPTLVIAPAGSDANVVAETSGLARRFEANDKDGIAVFLEDLIKGQPLERKDPGTYAWETIIRGFDRVLREAAGAGRSPRGTPTLCVRLPE
jgi:hypothetical protein